MRRFGYFNLAAALSFLVFATLVFTWDYTLDRPQVTSSFPYRGQMWELIFWNGSGTLRNDPQVNTEEEEFAHACFKLTAAFDQRSTLLVRSIRQLPRDSTERRAGVVELNQIFKKYRAELKRLRPKGLTEPADYTASLTPAIAITALLPLLRLLTWCCRRKFFRTMRDPRTVAAWASMAVVFVIAVATFRSGYATIAWEYDARQVEPALPGTLLRNQVWYCGHGVVFVNGELQFSRVMFPMYQKYEAEGFSRWGYVLHYDPAATPSAHATQWWLPGIAYAAEPPTRDQRGNVGSGVQRLSVFSLLLSIPFAVYPAVHIRSLRLARRRESRKQKQQCPNCGYDLTCNRSGVCPECGNPIERASRRDLTIATTSRA